MQLGLWSYEKWRGFQTVEMISDYAARERSILNEVEKVKFVSEISANIKILDLEFQFVFFTCNH